MLSIFIFINNDMKNFKQFLIEKYINVFTPEEKKPFLDDVWDILQKSYELHGGIKGKGFSDKSELLNFPDSMWKLNKQDGKLVAVSVYHDKRGGRKRVASGVVKNPDGKTNQLGKAINAQIGVEDLTTGRAWAEVSHASLKQLQTALGDKFWDYVIPFKDVQKKFPNEELIQVDGNSYQREIGGGMVTKIAVGNINAPRITIK